MNELDYREHIKRASTVFAPKLPRQSSDERTFQSRRDTRGHFVDSLLSASENEMPGYYSVYSFPRGHSKDGNIPRVDCIFIDLDVSGDDYDPDSGKTNFDGWRREMSALLARSRMIADAILEKGKEDHFRAALSGHKGIHLYLDFPPVDPANGSFQKFKAGLSEYGSTVMSWLEDVAGGIDMEPWVDVDASDLGRLARHPNTKHHGASYDEEQRWCVPVTISELSDIRCEDYLELTSGPRIPDGMNREPSLKAGKTVSQYIRTASPDNALYTRGNQSTSSFDAEAVERYDEQEADEEITLDDVLFFTRNKPCIKEFRERDDAYQHGSASRVMELSIMSRFIEMGVPRDVMHEFFSQIPGYDEATTDEMIDDLIGRQYGEFNCETITSKAPRFCLGDGCGIYRKADDLEK